MSAPFASIVVSYAPQVTGPAAAQGTWCLKLLSRTDNKAERHGTERAPFRVPIPGTDRIGSTQTVAAKRSAETG